MKNICIILIMLLLSSCQKKKPDDNLNLRFEVLEGEMKHIPKNIGIDDSWDYSYNTSNPYIGFNPMQDTTRSRKYGYIKLAKIRIINEGEPISIFPRFRYYFPTGNWTSKGVKQEFGIYCGYGSRTDDCRFFLPKKDSITVYFGYSSLVQPNTDTLELYLKWKRDSLGQDYVKFYMDNEKKLKYHSAKRVNRNSDFNNRFIDMDNKKCTIMKEVVEDTVIRNVRRD